MLRSANYTGRVAKWGTILGAFDIKYMARTSVKGQVLADLVVEFAECPKEVEMGNEALVERLVGVASIQAYRLGNYMLTEQLINEDQEWG